MLSRKAVRIISSAGYTKGNSIKTSRSSAVKNDRREKCRRFTTRTSRSQRKSLCEFAFACVNFFRVFFNFNLLFQSNNLFRRMESERSSQQLGMDERSQMAARLECWEKKCNELREENAKLK